MQINFLAAADGTPLTKTFSSSFGVLTKSAYPNVRNFNSHQADIASIDELYAAIFVHAEQHHCLVKGALTRELNNESRQNSTTSAAMTQWIVFDIDHLPGITTADDFVQLLPAPFHAASYVLQYSSSHGFTAGDLRAHLFFLLDTPVAPPVLKLWMKQLNLTVAAFSQHLLLAEGGCTLKWPVDISVNQNDKLVYIAPPICVGVEDPVPLTERIQLVRKTTGCVALRPDVNAEAIRTQELERLNALRAELGLGKKKLKLDNVDGYTVIKNADQMTLQAPPFEERGFVYMPLSSNRHSYYHPVGNHEFLYSFKDPEVAFPMQVVLPSYYWEQERDRAKAVSAETTIITFRDNRSDVKYVGSYSTDLKRVQFNRIKAREDIHDFFSQHHMREPGIIETWDYEFDPTTTERIRPTSRWVNKFVPTMYMELEGHGDAAMPANIKTLLLHIMNYDDECYEHFINWLAFKLQTRNKCKTAWFFQGVEGTGKGVLFNMVLNPLFGGEQCHLKRMDNLLDKFNAELETSLLWVIDEANIENFKEDGQITEKLKNLIVEDQQVIRAMHMNQYSAANYTDVILFSNQALAIKVSQTDRRYNVCPRQNVPLLRVMDRQTIVSLRNELPQLASYLMAYEVDTNRVFEPLDNQAKRDLAVLSRTTHDEFIHSLITGDMAYFIRAMTDQPDVSRMVAFLACKETLSRWIRGHIPGEPALINVQDIARMYSYIVGNGKPTAVNKMHRMLSLRGCELVTNRDESVVYAPVHWGLDELAAQRWLSSQSSQSQRGPHGQQSSPQAQ